MTTTLSPDSQICSIALIGDNHFGYMGYRSSVSPQVVIITAIGSVVGDWETKIIRSLVIFLHFIIH